MAAALSLQSESTLTDRYQTTVPAAVRKALRLGKRDKIHYSIQGDGLVVLSRAGADDEDPALVNFLGFLARDIGANPDRLRVLDPALADRVKTLAAGVEIDLDAPLSDEDE
ncbi:MAG TPA: type II toxin-antitoxin system PrlF family antitoxin [Alphaproteobacteria bacterium]|nr:type II toxin-antitoxin system PrlF family antitoxin [Alphaproteobacteria bacterium]